MAQAHGSALLKPMSADSLLRPDAARSMPATKKVTPPPVNGPSLMHPPTFAPRPAPVRQLPPEPAGDSDQLWENLDWLQEDVPADPDESEEDGEDAVPTEQMPVPAPVPLESYMPVRGGRHGRWVCLGALGGAGRRWMRAVAAGLAAVLNRCFLQSAGFFHVEKDGQGINNTI